MRQCVICPFIKCSRHVARTFGPFSAFALRSRQARHPAKLHATFLGDVKTTRIAFLHACATLPCDTFLSCQAHQLWTLANLTQQLIEYATTSSLWLASPLIPYSEERHNSLVERKHRLRIPRADTMAFIFTCGTHSMQHALLDKTRAYSLTSCVCADFKSLLKGYEHITVQCQNCGGLSSCGGPWY